MWVQSMSWRCSVITIKPRHSRPSETCPPLKKIPDEGARRRRKKNLTPNNPKCIHDILDLRCVSDRSFHFCTPFLVPQGVHWHIPYSHPMAWVWFRLSCRCERSNISCFGGLRCRTPKCIHVSLDLRGCSRSFVSLLHAVTCPPRCPLTRTTLTSGGAGLVRTQL